MSPIIEEVDKEGFRIFYDEIDMDIYSKSSLLKFLSYKKGKKPKFLNELIGLIALVHTQFTEKEVISEINIFKKNLSDEFRSLLKKRQVSEIEVLPEPKDIDTILSYVPIFLKNDFERIICVAISPKAAQNPPWLAIISPPSSSKSFILKLLNHPEISIFIDDLTDNSLAPGKANIDAADVSSLFNDANNKNFIMNDMSSIFGQRHDKVTKFLGILTSAYGGDYHKYSPGTGNKYYKTNFTIIMAMTIASYKKHRKYMTDIGTRFLFLKFRNIDKNNRFQPLTFKELSDMRLNTCAFVGSMMKKKLPLITQSLDDKIFDFAKNVTLLRTLMFAESMDDIEGPNRFYHELSWLIRCRALIRERIPILNDLEFFKGLGYESIGWEHHIKKIHGHTKKNPNVKDYLNKMIKAGLAVGVIESFTEYESLGQPVPYFKFTDDFVPFVSDYMDYKLPFQYDPGYQLEELYDEVFKD